MRTTFILATITLVKSMDISCLNVKEMYQDTGCCDDEAMNVSLPCTETSVDVMTPCPPPPPPPPPPFQNGKVGELDFGRLRTTHGTPPKSLTAYRVPEGLNRLNRYQPKPPMHMNPPSGMNVYGWWNPEKQTYPEHVGYYQELNHGASTYTGPDDHSVSFTMAHDLKTFFLSVYVTDDFHSGSDAGTAWNGDGVQFAVSTAENIGLGEDGKPLKQMLFSCAQQFVGNATHREAVTRMTYEKNVPTSVQSSDSLGCTDIVRNEEYHLTTYIVQISAQVFELDRFTEDFSFGLAFGVWDSDTSPSVGVGWSGLNYNSILYCASWGGIDSKCPQYNALVTLSGHTPPSYMHGYDCSANPFVCDSIMTYTPIPPMEIFKGSTLWGDAPVGEFGKRQYLRDGWHGREGEAFFDADTNAAYYVTYTEDHLVLSLMTHDLHHYGHPQWPWNGDGVQMSWDMSVEDVSVDCTQPKRPAVLANVNIVPNITADGNVSNLMLNWAIESTPVDLEDFKTSATFDRVGNQTYYTFTFKPAHFGKLAFTPGDVLPFSFIITDNAETEVTVTSWHNQNSWAGMGTYSIIGGKRHCANSFISLDPSGESYSALFMPPKYPAELEVVHTSNPAITPSSLQDSTWLNMTLSHPNATGTGFGKVLLRMTPDFQVENASHLIGLDKSGCGEINVPGFGTFPQHPCWFGKDKLLYDYGYPQGLQLSTSGTSFICEAMFEGLTEAEKLNVNPDDVDVCFTKNTKLDIVLPATGLTEFHVAFKLDKAPKNVRIHSIEDEFGVEFERKFPWDITLS